MKKGLTQHVQKIVNELFSIVFFVAETNYKLYSFLFARIYFKFMHFSFQ